MSTYKSDEAGFNPLLQGRLEAQTKSLVQSKHPGAISVVNYKGGVGKTTISCLLGYYLAEHFPKGKVLLLDIDPQCSLSLALGFDPDEVNKTDLTIYNLVKPTKWTKITQTNFTSYVFPPNDSIAPKNLDVVRGSFDVDELDMEIAQTLAGDGSKYVEHLYLYCKQMLNSFGKYDFIIIDCPPNKMFLTQAMLRASSFYLPVTIPDAISIFGMPRLLRWVRKIPVGEKTSGQPSVDECLEEITATVLKRIKDYRAKI